MKELKGTKTEANLMAAFAGESQATNKYTYYASKAKKDGYVQIAKIFEETAGNEREHAKLWFKLLHGNEVPDTMANLADAAAGENYEWTDMYAQFAKEAREEAGLDVVPTRLVAIHDRNRHNTPLYAYGIAKVFMLCEVIGGHFSPNIETSESAYFSLDNLPRLSVGKNTEEQIRLCFAAYKDKNWIPVID